MSNETALSTTNPQRNTPDLSLDPALAQPGSYLNVPGQLHQATYPVTANSYVQPIYASPSPCPSPSPNLQPSASPINAPVFIPQLSAPSPAPEFAGPAMFIAPGSSPYGYGPPSPMNSPMNMGLPMMPVNSLPLLDPMVYGDPMHYQPQFVFFPQLSASRSISPQPRQSESDNGLSRNGAYEESKYTEGEYERTPSKDRGDVCRNMSRPKSPQRRGPKFPWRSKQNKIDIVHGEVQKRFEEGGLWTEEQLRGADTVRTHVKTFQGLVRIHHALDRVLNSGVEILKFAAPISMKNKWQKKGFIVYIKLAHQEEVETITDIFRDSEWDGHFNKTDVALTVDEKRALAESGSETALRFAAA